MPYIKKSGFTLVELLVALSIIVIMSIIGILSFQSFNNQSRLNGERDKVYSALYDIQSDIIHAKPVYTCMDSQTPRGVCKSSYTCQGTCEYRVPSGYGVRFSGDDKYTLFADVDGDNVFDDNNNAETLDGGEKHFPSAVQFKLPVMYLSKWTGNWETTNYPVQMLFKRDGDILVGINGGSDNIQVRVMEIGLRDTQNNFFSYLYVNETTGIIYTQDTITSGTPAGSP